MEPKDNINRGSDSINRGTTVGRNPIDQTATGRTPVGTTPSTGINHGEYHEMDRTYDSDSSTIISRVEAKFERLYDQVEGMLTTQLDLARTEISEKIDRVERGVISLTTGGVATFFGVQFLLFAVVYALDFVLPLWGAALIVGGIVLAIGLALLSKAKKELEPSKLKPERTIRSMRETADAARREL